jgi:hypothetical protein
MTTELSISRPVPLPWVEALFAKMTGFYGAKFSDQWRGCNLDQVKALWADEMGKLTREELKRGADSLIGREWPPTLPEFVKLCRPTLDPEAAFSEAVAGCLERKAGRRGTWSHPAVYFAAQRVGPFDIVSQGYASLAGRWKKTLAECFASPLLGEIPEPALALPAPSAAQISREEAAARLEELQATGVLAPRTDHRRWSGKILDREKRGDPTLAHVAVVYAKQGQT